MVLAVDLLPERFRAVASGQDAGEFGNEAFAAGHAEEPAGVDDEAGGLPEAIEMADHALVAAFAPEPRPTTTGAAYGRKSGLGLDLDRRRGKLMTLKGVVTSDLYSYLG